MIYLKNNETALIEYLLEKNPATSKELAIKLNVSARSIKNYIRMINRDHPQMITSGQNGYTISKEAAIEFLDREQAKRLDAETYIPQTPQERAGYIIRKLLENKETSYDILDLCDLMFISESTLRSDMQIVRRKLGKFDLELISEKRRLYIKGSEKSKRSLISSLFYAESSASILDEKTLQKSFPNIDLSMIRKIVVDELDLYRCFANEYSLSNLVLHIAISADRLMNNHKNHSQNEEFSDLPSQEINMAVHIARQLDLQMNIEYSNTEIQELALLLVSRTSRLDSTILSAEAIEELLGSDTAALLELMTVEMNDQFGIDLQSPEFYARFAIHIHNLLKRARRGIQTRNPLTEDIRKGSPLIYDTAVFLAGIILEKTGIFITKDEITYLALHLGAAIETQKSLSEKVKAILYVPRYYDFHRQIVDRINAEFAQDLLIRDVIFSETEIMTEGGFEMLIACAPIHAILPEHVIRISPFVNHTDRKKIEKTMQDLKISKKRNVFRSNLKLMLKEELFFSQLVFNNKFDAIHFLCENLEKKNYVNKDFEKLVVERESLSSTAFWNFAIPHSMKMNANKTGISIAILQKPLPWDEKEVLIVILLCFDPKDRMLFNNLFETITNILAEPGSAQILSRSKTCEEFIENMTSLLT